MLPAMSSSPSPARGRWIAPLLFFAAYCLTPAALGRVVADDGRVDSDAFAYGVHALQGLLVLVGIVVLLRGLPGWLVPLGGLLGLVLASLGGWSRHQLVNGPPVGTVLPDRVLSLQEICDWITRDDPYLGRGLLDDQLAVLERALASGDPGRASLAREALADVLLRHGENERAIEELEQALALAEDSGADVDTVERVRRALGIAHLRSGEAAHCIAMHNAARCVFPIQGEGVWSDPEGALAAAACFEQVLAARPDDYDVRWLLNLAHMAAGSWPEGVRAQWRIVPEELASEDPGVPPFRDIAAEVGVATFNLAGGAILDDFDGDGLLDVFTTSMAHCEPMRFYHNEGAAGFVDHSERAGLSDQLGGFNCVQADYDADGRLDVYVMRGGWQGKAFGRQPNSLLRQGEDGRFEDVALEAGLREEAYPSQVAAWSDYDLDGELDLFVGNEGFACQLFRNDGSGRFEDVAEAAGVRNENGDKFPTTKGVAFGDYDNDGDPDLFLSNYGAPNRLYRNDGGGRFEDLAPRLGLAENDLPAPDPEALLPGLISVLGKDLTGTSGRDITFATWFWDYDNDGWLDLYVGGFGASLADFAASYAGVRSADNRRVRIYRNDGQGGFENVAAQLGIDDVRLPMGANYGDYDNDGWLDVYLGTGRPPYEFLVPNVLYRNMEGKRFADVTTATAVGHLQKGHGVSFGDLDNDGDLDLFAQMGGFYPADAFHDALFENPGNENRWVTLIVRGTTSNRSAIGTRIAVHVSGADGERVLHRVVSSGGSFGASSLQQEIGLGRAERIERIEVRWPRTGETQIFEGPAFDRFYEVVEGRDELVPLERPGFRFAAG